MGAALSAGKSGLELWTEKPRYFPGEVVQGVVALGLCEPVQGKDIKVVLEVFGFESCSWEEEPSGNAQDASRGTFRRELLNVSQALHVWEDAGGVVPAGQYEFSFKVLLPSALPGSFRLREANTTRGGVTYQKLSTEVEYRLRAELLRSPPPGAGAGGSGSGSSGGGAGGGGTCVLRSSKELVVRQPAPLTLSELTATEELRVTRCCCLVYGSVELRLRAVHDSFCPGETGYLSLEVHNKTDVSLRVHVALQQLLSVATEGACNYMEETRVYSQRCEDLPNGASFQGTNARLLPLPLDPALPPTTVGQLVRCTYRAHVTVAAGRVGASRIEMVIPLVLHAPASTSYIDYGIRIPDGWKPSLSTLPVHLAVSAATSRAQTPQHPNRQPQPLMAVGSGDAGAERPELDGNAGAVGTANPAYAGPS
ncbi:hypothetical protein HYH03_009527 [Edaphochlamys debaryana]|uniref:Arrestin C-terminal-like domain-containing protein n=1 Tax=Edaphochlamys debaryana TaxID=47281 RepID=A0A835XW99_9CHLO|nr:hypothetical protein HYH03_009527 [Edaphochlamys debaryana]|eukprot:KAG2492287.1 hypothetical protein HYH03_009527 [Edaphochlamys debaryana]